MNIAMERKTGRINEWSRTLKKQLKYMNALTGRLSREQFNFKPEPNKWSVGQCIEHLNLSMRAYLDLMKPAVTNASREAEGTFTRGTMMGRLMLRALRTPGRSYPAPKSFMPQGNDLDPGTVRGIFETEITCLQQVLWDSKGLALGQITMPWPVFRLIKISLAQAFELQILHNDRHFKQAEQVILSEHFPKRESPNV